MGSYNYTSEVDKEIGISINTSIHIRRKGKIMNSIECDG